MKAWQWFAVLQGGWFVTTRVYVQIEKERVFDEARRTADILKKPLLNYGCKNWMYAIERSDINMDIVPRDVPRFMLATPDTGRLPFKDKEIGAVFLSHVLEHVHDPEGMLKELNRVADYVYVIVPHWWDPMAWFTPDHKRVYIGETVVENPQPLARSVLLGLNLVVFLLSY